MAAIKTEKTVRFHTFHPDAEKKLSSFFSPERVAGILSILNLGEQRILSECWSQLYQDLLQHPEPQSMSIPMFMFHFHNYAS
jgi:hypothetical protein